MIVWHAVVGLVLFASALLGVMLAIGALDPIGSSYYGIVADLRLPYLLLMLASLQLAMIVEAVILASRHRTWRWRVALLALTLLLPLATVMAIAWLDVWRYRSHTIWANVVAGILMASVLAAVIALRFWAWRHPDVAAVLRS